jgi:hypothetical protein
MLFVKIPAKQGRRTTSGATARFRARVTLRFLRSNKNGWPRSSFASPTRRDALNVAYFGSDLPIESRSKAADSTAWALVLLLVCGLAKRATFWREDPQKGDRIIRVPPLGGMGIYPRLVPRWNGILHGFYPPLPISTSVTRHAGEAADLAITGVPSAIRGTSLRKRIRS